MPPAMRDVRSQKHSFALSQHTASRFVCRRTTPLAAAVSVSQMGYARYARCARVMRYDVNRFSVRARTTRVGTRPSCFCPCDDDNKHVEIRCIPRSVTHSRIIFITFAACANTMCSRSHAYTFILVVVECVMCSICTARDIWCARVCMCGISLNIMHTVQCT